MSSVAYQAIQSLFVCHDRHGTDPYHIIRGEIRFRLAAKLDGETGTSAIDKMIGNSHVNGLSIGCWANLLSSYFLEATGFNEL